MNISNLVATAHDNSKKHGFHDEPEHIWIRGACCNLHDEVSELHEAWRANKLRDLCDKSEKMAAQGLPPLTCLEEELADIVIRAADFAGRMGVDLERAIEVKHRFNVSRPHMHGKLS